jgi:hypothetical protein
MALMLGHEWQHIHIHTTKLIPTGSRIHDHWLIVCRVRLTQSQQQIRPICEEGPEPVVIMAKTPETRKKNSLMSVQLF